MINLENLKLLIDSAIWQVPLLVGIVEVVKGLGVPTRFMPLIALILGVLLGLMVLGFNWTSVIVGIVLGLSASGLYDVGRKTVLDK